MLAPVLYCRGHSGHLPLLLNFLCSLKEYKIALPKHIIFAATKSTAAAVKRLGLTVYWHEALGNFKLDDQAAAKYADGTFGNLMWLKTFSVYLALEAGIDVLFQDGA